LELPIQGATGYTSVELPLWADPADQEAAATAVEEWEKAEEERKRLEEEQKRLEEERARAEAEAAAQAQAQGGTSSPSASGGQTTAPAEQATPAPDASGGGETAPAAGETETAEPQEGTSSAQTGTDPAQPGEIPEAETPAVQEPAPETPATEPDPSGSTGTPATEPETPAETEPEEEEEPPTLTDGTLALVASGTPFTVLQEEGDWWQVAVTTDYFTDEEQTQTQRGEITGWLEHKYCLVNLPDVIPSIIYDATNSYSSHFRSCGKVIPEVTGEAFYPSKTYNERLGKMEFMMPVLYSMAFKLCEAQQSALAEGNSLILYEGYRPHEVQTKVLNSLSAMTRTDPEVKEAVTGAPWRISWFISGGYSNHQRGYAVDMGLAKVSETKEYTTGGYRYVRVWNYERYEMPTPIHELSRAAATYTAPVTINSTTAWKSAEMTQAMASNEPALGLQRYCTDAELTPLASEWWHFNYLSTRSQVLDNQGIGDFLISSVRSAAPA
ncbi:MAG: D-alanyl-D-alanine carboxypeptidase family protein, partial [Oscillospiraceae bacterium]|nr:D-alanyl-D-alanine carboxypeptidase family protein [Oscillospiraceae bacterium]